jgi:acylphosphatase
VPLHLKVNGDVQGVGFRQYVRNAGERLQLAGWVRNTDDGGVEVLAEGAPSAEEALLVAVRRGPRGARVADVRVVPQDGQVQPLPFPFSVQF